MFIARHGDIQAKFEMTKFEILKESLSNFIEKCVTLAVKSDHPQTYLNLLYHYCCMTQGPMQSDIIAPLMPMVFKNLNNLLERVTNLKDYQSNANDNPIIKIMRSFVFSNNMIVFFFFLNP